MYDYRYVSPETIRAEADQALARADALVDQAAAAADSPTLDATLGALELAGAEMSRGYGRSAFLAHVHPDAAVRDAGQEAEERLNKWRVAVIFREDVYRAVSAFAATAEAEALEGEPKRLLEHWLRDLRRAGHELEPEQRVELESLRSRLVELEVAFQRNLNEYRDWIDVDRAGLAGLPDDYIARLGPGDAPGTFRVSLDYPEFQPFLELADDRSLRETLFRKNWNRAVDANRPLLEEALRLRRRIAELLDYPTWAHYAMAVKMAGSPERVREFYADLVPVLEGAAQRDIATLREMAAADGVQAPLQPWDWLYYDSRMSREQYGVDKQAVSQYLPLDAALAGVFELTGEVLGLDYREIDDPKAWHPSVRAWEIIDRASGEPLARFYADLFPREGKFGHAAAFPLVIEHQRPDGSREVPISAIVANFPAPSREAPSLLTHGDHGDAETFFHEFGHILHQSLSRARFTRFSGSETEWDFVEAPSQIMEHWVWQPEVLARFARHHRSGDPLPPQLIEKMVAARYLNVGMRGARQIFYGTMDLALHAAPGPPDLDAAIRDSYAVTQLPYPEGTFMLAGFGHVMGGYDAGYYGYLWAEVIGDEMWSRFAAEGITSPRVGADYRREILEPNGAKAGEDLVMGFLGRPASVDGYLTLRGLSRATAESAG